MVSSSNYIEFSGYRWSVKDYGSDQVGPGPNYFRKENVFVDQEGYLHLNIKENKEIRKWTCGEVILDKALGYGTYTFVVNVKHPTEWNENIVFGAFTWDDNKDQRLKNPNREIDFEISKWGMLDYPQLQYVVQPDSGKGMADNIHRIEPDWKTNQEWIMILHWGPKKLRFQTLVPLSKQPKIIDEFTYEKDLIPDPGSAAFRFNL